jgi:hypothetical protein
VGLRLRLQPAATVLIIHFILRLMSLNEPIALQEFIVPAATPKDENSVRVQQPKHRAPSY